MKHNYSIDYQRIHLRALEEGDIEKLRVLRNKNQQFFVSRDEITTEQQKKWYQAYLTRDDDVMFAVELRSRPGEFIGAIALYDIDWDSETAEFGRTVIDKDLAKEKGVGMEATIAVCLLGFDILHLKKIVGFMFKSNERIIKVYTRAGFVITGEYDADSWAVEMTRDTINLAPGEGQ